jgi:Nif-specific regulatory protein
VKILRVLQEQEFEPVGSNKPIQVNAGRSRRQQNLEAAVREALREDLFYRLNVIPIRIHPCARGRTTSDPRRRFLDVFNQEKVKEVKGIAGAMGIFQQYDWPGTSRSWRTRSSGS